MTAGDLHGRTVAILAAGGVERVELDLSRGALHGAGARVEVLSVPTGSLWTRGWDRDPAGTVEFARTFLAVGRPVAAVYHGPWPLVEADVVRGCGLTSWAIGRIDLRNAGAGVVDEEVWGDGRFVTSRSLFDLPASCSAIVTRFAAVPARD